MSFLDAILKAPARALATPDGNGISVDTSAPVDGYTLQVLNGAAVWLPAASGGATYDPATESADGLMSAADKAKLNSILGYNYANATPSAAGLMSGADKTSLNTLLAGGVSQFFIDKPPTNPGDVLASHTADSDLAQQAGWAFVNTTTGQPMVRVGECILGPTVNISANTYRSTSYQGKTHYQFPTVGAGYYQLYRAMPGDGSGQLVASFADVMHCGGATASGAPTAEAFLSPVAGTTSSLATATSAGFVMSTHSVNVQGFINGTIQSGQSYGATEPPKYAGAAIVRRSGATLLLYFNKEGNVFLKTLSASAVNTPVCYGIRFNIGTNANGFPSTISVRWIRVMTADTSIF